MTPLMSVPPPSLPASLSTSGYEDGLGARTLTFDRETGGILERLHLRAEFAAFESAIRQRFELGVLFEDERFAHPRAVERDPHTGGVVVVSEFVTGNRLSDILEGLGEAVDETTPPGVDAALGFLLEILPALATLHSATGFTHGAVGPGRIVVTPAGQVVLLDWMFGHTLERVRLDPQRLWRQFGIAMQPVAGTGSFDATADVAQAALAAVAIVMGRPLRSSEFPDGLAAAAAEVVEIAQISGTARFATALQRFLHRALPLPAKRPFRSADEADAAVRQLAAEIGVSRCRAALASFVSEFNRVQELGDALQPEPLSQDFYPASEPEPEDAPLLEEPEDARQVSAAMEFEIQLDSVTDDDTPVHDEDAAEPVAYELALDAMPAEDLADAVPAALETEPFGTLVDTPEVGNASTEATDGSDITLADEHYTEGVHELPPDVSIDPPTADPEQAGEPEPAWESEPPYEPAIASEAPATAQGSDVEEVAFDAPVETPFTEIAVAPAIIEEPVAIEELVAIEEPVATEEPVDFEEPAAVEEPISLQEPVPVHEPVMPPVAEIAAPPPPAPKAPPARHQRRRGAKRDRDKLRSLAKPAPAPVVVAPPPAPAPPPVPPAPAAAPVPVPTAAPRAFVPAPVRQQPAPMPYYPPMFDPREAAAAPPPAAWTFAPTPSIVPPAPPVIVPPAAPAPIRIKPSAAAAPVRVRNEAPAGYAPPARRAPFNETTDDGALPRQRDASGRAPKLSPLQWKLAGAAALVVAVGVGAIARPYLIDRPQTPAQAPAPQAAPGPVSKPTTIAGGSLALVTQPAGARVLLDGAPAGETPLTIESVAPGRHIVTFMTAAGAVKKTVRIEAGKTVSLDLPVYSGWVAVFAPVLLDIAENGRTIGTTEQGRLMLPPGRHQLTFSSREYGYSSTQTVEIEPGEERSVNVQPTGVLNLNALPWAEVWIDGRKAGDTPIAHLNIPVGTHEVTFKHPQFGDRKVTATVTASTPATASVDFAKPQQP